MTGFFWMTVILRMISFGYDYHWTCMNSRFDRKVSLSRPASRAFVDVFSRIVI